MEQKAISEIEESFLAEEVVEEEYPMVGKKTENKTPSKETSSAEKAQKVKKVASARKASSSSKVEKPKVSAKKSSITIEKAAPKAISIDDIEDVPSKVEAAMQTPKVEVVSISQGNDSKKESPKDSSSRSWDDESEQMFSGGNAWAVLSGVLVILLLISVFTGGFDFGTGSGGEISLSEAEGLALEYVNSELLPDPFVATVTESGDVGEVYRVALSVGGQEIDSYVSKDGELFFPQGFALGEETVVVEELAGSEVESGVNRIEVSTGDNAIHGNPDALVTIVEFSDYECPFCRRFVDDTLPLIEENYIDTGIVNLVYRDFPLSAHPSAQKAAEAAQCAGEQDMYYEMHDLLFENQEDLSEENYVLWAGELGLDVDSFSACLESSVMEAEVLADMAYGESLGVTGTPAFFVNGEMLSGALPYAEFEAAIERALAELESTEEVVLVEETVVEEETSAEETVEEEAISGDVSFDLAAKRWLFEPRSISVSVGDTVVLNIMPEGLDFTFAIAELGVSQEVSGDTAVSFVASTAGEFEYSCSSCEDWRGMTGTLVVE